MTRPPLTVADARQAVLDACSFLGRAIPDFAPAEAALDELVAAVRHETLERVEGVIRFHQQNIGGDPEPFFIIPVERAIRQIRGELK